MGYRIDGSQSTIPILSSSASVPSPSPPERDTAVAAAIAANGKPQLGGSNNGGTGSSLNPVTSSVPPTSMPLPSSSAPGEVNTSLVLQENAILRDQVRHLAALQWTGWRRRGLHGDEGRSDNNEPPREYVESDIDEDSRR
ncbi:hypothetical protein M408DRAFT_23114 [Serendipita vermifera MAFF 305830]|uniref:Uncharacterized protein n=1 Tax=Serendipita vermifera MAFF 305830 TaxID=933852 RepID=A0A0C3AXT5_SERVB|nr:hypothetical protein M408DRAFT_23114 [Serendipita vermifera MAFF 305830]